MEEERQRVFAAAGRLLEKLEQAVEELDKGTVTHKEKQKDGDAEVIFEVSKGKGKGLVDRGGLKQLTGVLKDLQDILSQDDQMDARERELKLQQLERNLSGAADARVTVRLEGEAMDYAE